MLKRKKIPREENPSTEAVIGLSVLGLGAIGVGMYFLLRKPARTTVTTGQTTGQAQVPEMRQLATPPGSKGQQTTNTDSTGSSNQQQSYSTSDVEMNSGQVSFLLTILRALGYQVNIYKTSISEFSAGDRSIIGTYQGTKNIPRTGYLDYPTVNALQMELRERRLGGASTLRDAIVLGMQDRGIPAIQNFPHDFNAALGYPPPIPPATGFGIDTLRRMEPSREFLQVTSGKRRYFSR